MDNVIHLVYQGMTTNAGQTFYYPALFMLGLNNQLLLGILCNILQDFS